MLGTISVRDYMASNLITLSPDTDILSAIRQIIANRISGAPVVDADGHLVGMLSERDCLKVALQADYYAEAGAKVSEFMTTDVRTIDVSTNILELAEMFVEQPYRRYPVTEAGRLVGQISVRDVLRALD